MNALAMSNVVLTSLHCVYGQSCVINMYHSDLNVKSRADINKYETVEFMVIANVVIVLKTSEHYMINACEIIIYIMCV